MKDQDIKTIVKSVPIIIAVGLYLIFAPDKDEKQVEETKNQTAPTTEVSTNETSTKAVISLQEAQQATGNEPTTATFVNANDGDTINVMIDGEKQRIRLLMIDTPEMNYNKGEPDPYAQQAKDFTINVLQQANDIQVLVDKGPATDDYDRLLAYVYVDGVLLQESLLKEGLGAIRYVNKPNNSLETQLRAIQKDAEQTKINIWSEDGYFENNRFNPDAVK
jgi:micrococcal nuclease